uniref:Uncharacterized protein n=1 Tax=Melanopsichium pennsylvanicum 4 TaxID=1398559 RepID=A0A077RCI6_9BASI|nr:uncharacterized protein BN887_03755 [Melanopsichium pennsylvanicum 4]
MVYVNRKNWKTARPSPKLDTSAPPSKSRRPYRTTL